ncbi:MAG: hypothetical protein ACRD4S_17065 [Candidatus Acidiferrales bacterium]
MKMLGMILGALIAASVAGAQQASTIQMQCRPMSSSGNTFMSQGETVINGRICHAVATPISAAVLPTAPPKLAGPPEMEVLPDGTSVSLRLTEGIDSSDANKGDRISFEVVEDVILDGHVVIPKGAVAMGTVVKADHKKRLGRSGKLDIALQYVTAAGGEKIPLRGAKVAKSGNPAGANAVILGATVVVAPVAVLFLMRHGKDVSMDAGTPVNASVDGAARVNINAGVLVAAK